MNVLFKRPDGTFVILHKGFPYHVLMDDPLFEDAAAAGAEAPFEPAPDPVPAPQTVEISFAQLIGGLVTEGWISKAEGQAWLRGTLPAQVTALIAQLPEEQQIFAEARALNPTSVLLSDPLVQALAASQGKTPAQLETFFNAYGAA